MDPIQEEYGRAVEAGINTLRAVPRTYLTNTPIDRLQQMAWDLERITAALHREIDTRLDGPVDTA